MSLDQSFFVWGSNPDYHKKKKNDTDLILSNIFFISMILVLEKNNVLIKKIIKNNIILEQIEIFRTKIVCI